jgi:hypothetical protein
MTSFGIDFLDLSRIWRRRPAPHAGDHGAKVERIAADLRRWSAERPLSLRKKAVSRDSIDAIRSARGHLAEVAEGVQKLGESS